MLVVVKQINIAKIFVPQKQNTERVWIEFRSFLYNGMMITITILSTYNTMSYYITLDDNDVPRIFHWIQTVMVKFPMKMML